MKQQNRSYSDEFKRQVLEDYFRSGKTKAACCRQWGIPWTTLQKWVDACTIAGKSVPLHRFLRMSPILVIATTDTVKKLTFLV